MVANQISKGGNEAGGGSEKEKARQVAGGPEGIQSASTSGDMERMKLINRSSFSDELIRAVIRFTRPPGIKRFTVTVTDRKGYVFNGHGSSKGVLVRINHKAKFPRKLHTYQYGQLKARWSKPDPVTGAMRQLKGRRYYVANKTEALIYVMAHELMHTKQGQRGKLRGRVWGARGRYSEIQTESYAIRKLRDYRQNT